MFYSIFVGKKLAWIRNTISQHCGIDTLEKTRNTSNSVLLLEYVPIAFVVTLFTFLLLQLDLEKLDWSSDKSVEK